MGLEALASKNYNICPFCRKETKQQICIDGRTFFECQNDQCRAIYAEPMPKIDLSEVKIPAPSLVAQVKFMMERCEVATKKIAELFESQSEQQRKKDEHEKNDNGYPTGMHGSNAEHGQS